MQAIGYYLAFPFIYLISLLPFPLLYLFSDLVFFLLYHVIGYRKKVATENLRKSFPEKSEKEILKLRKKFYQHLSDVILETFKTLSISRSAMLERCRFDERSIQLMKKLLHEKKSFIFVLGHLGNWEWSANIFSLQFKEPLYAIYHPLKNKHFDRLIYKMRTRFGTNLIEMKNVFREMMARKNEVNATAFIADQTPPPENAYWTTFLNQDTPVFQGTEKIACKLNFPVVYVNINRVRRGYYEMRAEMLCENPASTSDGEISEMFTKKLEKDIRKNPEIWLWSHRRWKHQRPR